MQGFVETIHLFKTQPDIVVPLLQRYVKIDDTERPQRTYTPIMCQFFKRFHGLPLRECRRCASFSWPSTPPPDH